MKKLYNEDEKREELGLYIKICIEELITVFMRNMIRTSYIYNIQ